MRRSSRHRLQSSAQFRGRMPHSHSMLELTEKLDVARRPAVAPDSDHRAATVAVVGLGYVGLPVAVEFGKRRSTIGYDVSRERIENLQRRFDTTGEITTAELEEARRLRVTRDPAELGQADFVIVA